MKILKNIYMALLAMAVLVSCEVLPQATPLEATVGIKCQQTLENLTSSSSCAAEGPLAMGPMGKALASPVPPVPVLQGIMEVWSQDGTRRVLRQEMTIQGNSALLTIRLVPGTYQFLFWADKDQPGSAGNYDTDVSLKAVRLNLLQESVLYDPLPEAFSASQEVVWDGKKVDVTLKRPFAQLNVLSKTPLAAVKDFSILYKGVPTAYDVMTQQSSDFRDLRVTGSLMENDELVHSSYFLVPPEGRHLGMEVTVGTGNTAVVRNMESVPLQANYKTNILAEFNK